MQQEGTVQRDRQEGALKLLLGRICCVIGLLLGAGGFVVLGIAAVFFMAAASTGLIPGIEPLGHGYD